MPKLLRMIKIGLPMLLALVCLSSCASYSESMRDAHRAVAASQPEHAEEILNGRLQTQDSGELPMEIEQDSVLLLLERATVLQALGHYELAARDMMVVDDNMVFLSIADAGSLNIAKYMFSEDSADYVAPAYERLLVNSLNMLNYMAQGDIQGAKVEARRFTIMEQFYLDSGEPALLNGILAFGNYLSGVAFEHSRDYSQAARYYSRAWYYGVQSPEFRQRLVDLLAITGYKVNDLKRDHATALDDLLEAAQARQDLSISDYRDRYLKGDTLIVMQTGMAPWREAERLPIGTALTYSDGARGFSSQNRSELNVMISNGTIDSVSFPMLTTRGLPSQQPVSLQIDGGEVPIHMHVDVSSQVAAGYAHILPQLMVAAITRLMTRAVAGGVTGAAVKAGTDSSGWGALAGLAVTAGMAAADTPDTRSWMTLPGGIRLVRTNLPAEAHSIQMHLGAQSDARSVEIHEDSLNLLNFSRLR